MKYLTTAAIGFALLASPVQASEAEMTLAAEMTATYVVYITECKPSDEMKEQLRSVARLHQEAAGVDADNRQFAAMTMIKAVEYARSARANPNFCKRMTEAFRKGQTEK